MPATMTPDEYVLKVTKSIKDAVMKETAPWYHHVSPGERDLPHDPVSGVVYNDLNGAYLDVEASNRGFKDPRWFRREDLEKAGYTVRYGEVPVTLAKMVKGIAMKEGNNLTSTYTAVYNAEQLKGVPSYERSQTPHYVIDARNAIESNSHTHCSQAAEVAKCYFEEKSSTPGLNAELLKHIASYTVALYTRTEYTPPDRAAINETKFKLYKLPARETTLLLANAHTFATKATTQGFYFQPYESLKRHALKDNTITMKQARPDNSRQGISR